MMDGRDGGNSETKKTGDGKQREVGDGRASCLQKRASIGYTSGGVCF